MGDFEKLERKVDAISDKLDMIILHLMPPPHQFHNDENFSILTESAEPDMAERLDNLKLTEEQMTQKELGQLETWMNSDAPSFVELKTGDFEPVQRGNLKDFLKSSIINFDSLDDPSRSVSRSSSTESFEEIVSIQSDIVPEVAKTLTDAERTKIEQAVASQSEAMKRLSQSEVLKRVLSSSMTTDQELD